MPYEPRKIEKKWQRIWKKNNLYRTPDKVKGKNNFYCLDMFPYPSGEGLHVGHLHGYIGSDIVSRYLRMKGFNVLHPMGFDAFGLPAENAAIKRKIHPKTWTYRNIRKIRKQLASLGACYDWEREVITCEPSYYKWTQWMFLQLYKAGLAYRAKVPANWCPSCKTVLANEQVIEGRCERCKSEVVQKEIEQWLFKITDYAEELLKDLDQLDWPERTKEMQKNWIGKSEGYEIVFKIKALPIPAANQTEKENKPETIKVFTTRADTLFGATYLVLAPEHPIIEKLKGYITNYRFVKGYIEKARKKTERERISKVKEKTGVELKGIRAVNPVNNREIPIFVADYVLKHYGTGAIMAVPCHDQRDFDFAKKYNLPMIEVIRAVKATSERLFATSGGGFERAYEGDGYLVNSGRFNGMDSKRAREAIGKYLARKKLAKFRIHYKLRDWLISRQRYWGCPIPMIYCPKCHWQPVPEKDLPVLLPRINDFRPTGKGTSPLERSKKFVETRCPKCGGKARRETDTMDTFVCSSWYYLRYADPKNEKEFASKEALKEWLPVDIYVGGAEHAVMHLLYARFFTKVLRSLGYLNFREPFLKLRHQGTILGPDNQKMSKSRGNVIPVDKAIEKYGVDAIRLYEMFMGPFEATSPWDTKGIMGCVRFLKRVYRLANEKPISEDTKISPKLESIVHITIKKVSEDIEGFRFNTAISSLMVFLNELEKQSSIALRHLKILIKLLAPFAPHLAEELWQKCIPACLANNIRESSVHNQKWPQYETKWIVQKTTTLVIEVNGKVRDKIEVFAGISKEKAENLALEREKIKRHIEGKKIKKIIFVPNKLVNIVVEK